VMYLNLPLHRPLGWFRSEFNGPDDVWSGTPEQIQFRETVLKAHIASKKTAPTPDLPGDKLTTVPGTKVPMRFDAAQYAGHLIAAANRELAIAQAAGDTDALKTTLITASSGYRDANYQAGLWRRYFPAYYNETATARGQLADGPHGKAAVKKMLGYLSWKIAAPGYSNHQAGVAIDLKQRRKKGSEIKNSTKKYWTDKWRGTWLFRWLLKNASVFQFYPYSKEPWHWEYRPAQASSVQGVPSFHYLRARSAGPVNLFRYAGVSGLNCSCNVRRGFGEATAVSPTSASAAFTIYPKIELGIGRVPNRAGKLIAVQPVTGIFVPERYSAQPEVDLIVYLHGHKSAYPGDGASIEQYWDAKRFPFFALREGVNESGKNVVLIAPTLGPLSQAGRLMTRGGFDAYIEQVIRALNEQGLVPRNKPRVENARNIILACHSGGGKPMLRIALSGDKNASRIKQCWGFDCLYSGYDKATKKKLYSAPNAWLKWAGAQPASRLLIFYKGTTALEAEYLAHEANKKKLSNVLVAESNAKRNLKIDPHYWVPLAHWKQCIQSAAFLANR